MAIDLHGVRFLLYAKKKGVDFSRSAMIGRQFFVVSPDGLKKALVEFGFSHEQETLRSIFDDNHGYAEGFLRYLGAREVHSFDCSDYESATHLHDLNQELPDCYKERYSMVLDGGSLEHVFNFPVALRNCMEMVQIGGHYLASTPVNNLTGHGFYQFSPELYSSSLSEANGYEMLGMAAYEDVPSARWFAVVNPSSVSSRVTLINRVPTILLVVARRIQKTALFKSMPQQIHYVHMWRDRNKEVWSPEKSSRLRAFAGRLMPTALKRSIRRRLGALLGYNEEGFDPSFFQPMNPADCTQAFGVDDKRSSLRNRSA